MNNFNRVLEYTSQKKEYQKKNLEKSFYFKPFEELNLYLKDEEDDFYVGASFGHLSTWYHWSFINDYVVDNSLNYQDLAVSTYLSVESNNYYFFIGKIVETYNTAVPLHEAIKHLAQMLYLGWDKKAIEYGNFLIKNLTSKHYNGGVSIPVHQWFILELFCKWQNINLDKEKISFPSDLKVYSDALSHWNTNDDNLLTTLVDKLSYYHIENCSEDVVKDENGNEFSPDFSSSNYFVFAIEIVMWLSIRKRLSLKDYLPSNELMALDINKLPNKVFPYANHELVQQCKNKLMKENPNIKFDL